MMRKFLLAKGVDFLMLEALLFIFAVGAAVASVDTTCGLNVLGSLDSTKVCRTKYALVYTLSCTLGGMATGAVLGGIGYVFALTPIVHLQFWLIAIGFAVLLFMEFFNLSGRLPSGNFIVPSVWIQSAGYRSAALWGSILGLGFITLQAGVLFHAYMLLSIFTFSWETSIWAGVCFGFVRGSLFSLPIIRSVVYASLTKRWLHRTMLTAFRQFVSGVLLIGSILWLLMA